MGGNFFGGDYLCCPGPSAPQEHNFNDRVRNAVTQLPDAQSVSALGEILFVAWNQQPLGSIQVDGAAPQRRDLNLIVSPYQPASPRSIHASDRHHRRQSGQSVTAANPERLLLAARAKLNLPGQRWLRHVRIRPSSRASSAL
jgi:hypothetical protein